MGNTENTPSEEPVCKHASAEKPRPKINPNIKDKKESNEDKYVDETELMLEEARSKIANDAREFANKADNLYRGSGEYSDKSEDERVQMMYDLFNQISNDNYDELGKFIDINMEYEEHQRLFNIVLKNVNKEDTVIQKLKIIIRDLQEKTPLIHEEVTSFVVDQKKWREEKEEEFQKSIENIRSQMTPQSHQEHHDHEHTHEGEGEGDGNEPKSPKSAMEVKYKEL